MVCGYKSGRDENGNFIYFERPDGHGDKKYLPRGWHGTKQIRFLRGPPDGGRTRFFLLNELGHLSLIAPDQDFAVVWKLRLPHAAVSHFALDANGKHLVATTSDGKLILFDMPALLAASRADPADPYFERLFDADPGVGAEDSRILAPLEYNQSIYDETGSEAT